MIFLSEVSIIAPYRSLPVNLNIKLQDLVVFVGGQGTGKSSLLDLLSRHDKRYINYVLNSDGNSVKSYYFDTETMNPRTKNAQLYSSPDGTDIGIGVKNALLSRWKSHGEILKQFTVDIVNTVENSVILLDEPESALCLSNQYKLARELKLASENNQVIISTHSLVLIKSVPHVFDLTTKQWIESKKYIKSTMN